MIIGGLQIANVGWVVTPRRRGYTSGVQPYLTSFLIKYRDLQSGEIRETIYWARTRQMAEANFSKGRIINLYECDGWSGEPVR